MQCTINSRIIRNRGFGLDEFLGLLLLKHCYNPNLLLDNLKHKGLIIQDGELEGIYYLTEEANNFLEDTLCAMNKDCPRDTQVDILAEALMNIFPKGTKRMENSSRGISWRGNKKDISERLRKFFDKYGRYSYDDIIEATKRYVDSFNGDYSYMRVLKYFIWKEEKQYDDYGVYTTNPTSDLADAIENKDTEEEHFVLGELR